MDVPTRGLVTYVPPTRADAERLAPDYVRWPTGTVHTVGREWITVRVPLDALPGAQVGDAVRVELVPREKNPGHPLEAAASPPKTF